MSCLFISLAPAVGLHPEVLRKKIADYLRTNPKLMDDIDAKTIIEWTEGTSLANYANKMSRPGVWGGAIEIRAFCEMYEMDVTVHVLYTHKAFIIESSFEPCRVVHINYNGSHFEPMYVELIE